MEYIFILLFGAIVFGLCFLLDRGFTKQFRGKSQHKSGKAVRLNRRYATAGVLLCFLGIAFIVTTGWTKTVLFICSIVILLLGIALIVYYISFGIYYDDETFLVSGFARKDRVYYYRDIHFQQRYLVTGGNILLELHMTDAGAVQLYSQMDGVKDFLEHAHKAWCRQKHVDGDMYLDPENAIYFPSEEDT